MKLFYTPFMVEKWVMSQEWNSHTVRMASGIEERKIAAIVGALVGDAAGKLFVFHKNPKHLVTQKICCSHPKIWTKKVALP